MDPVSQWPPVSPRGEDLISYPLRNKEDNFQYGHGSQLLLCTHIGHVIILIMP